MQNELHKKMVAQICFQAISMCHVYCSNIWSNKMESYTTPHI